MSSLATVRRYFPFATDQECRVILWNATAFPAGDEEFLESQILEAARFVHPWRLDWRTRLNAYYVWFFDNGGSNLYERPAP